MVARPVFYGGMMVKRGDADTMVAGVCTATANVIQAGALTVGYAPRHHDGIEFLPDDSCPSSAGRKIVRLCSPIAR